MKTRKLRLGSLLSTAIFVSATMVPAEPVVADFGNTKGYHVSPGRTTNKDQHDNASYMVFKTSPAPNKQFGILFMQTQGSFPYQPFLCVNASWNDNEKSAQCSVLKGQVPGLQILEQVTVGQLNGPFCAGLAVKHNPEFGPGPDPIMKPVECPTGAQCSCYEVLHFCRFGDDKEWKEESCPDLAQAYSGGLGTRGGETRFGGQAPPGRGAGSGGSN